MASSAGQQGPAPGSGSEADRSRSPHHSPRGFFVDHFVELLALATVLFILQTGFVPFDFALTGGHTAFFTTEVNDVILPDVISNIFLYVPFGVFIHWSILRRMRRCPRLIAALLTLLLAVPFSAVIEFLQAYSPARVSSLIDLISNSVGAALGVSLSWVAQIILPRALGTALVELRASPQAAILKAYVLLLCVFAAMPFSFSFDVARLKTAAKGTVLVPFGYSQDQHALMVAADRGDDPRAADLLKWSMLKRWSRWAAEAASFMLLAWMLRATLVVEYGFSRWATPMLLLWLGAGLAVGLSAIQFIVVSRLCDVTDILFRVAGLVGGTLLSSVYWRERALLTPMLLRRRHRRYARFGCVLTVVYLLYTGLIPLSFGNTGGVGTAVLSEGFLPFFSYFVARFDVMMEDVMEKFAAYAVFAALLMTGWTQVFHPDKRPRIASVVALGVALQAVVEIVQASMPVRVMSLTDLILAGAGCLTGALAQQQAVRFAHAARESAKEPHHRGRSDAEPALQPGDALVASLMDQDPDAPTEPTERHPQRQPRS